MSTVQIDPTATRVAAAQTTSALDLLVEVRSTVVAASQVAAFTDEHQATLLLADELDEEIGTIGRVLGLTADRAEVADSGYGLMLDTWIASASDALRRSINDADGANVSGLLGTSGTTLAGQRELLATVSPEAARAWFASLPASTRMQLVATEQAMFDGTPLASVVNQWKQALGSPALRELFTLRALDTAGIDVERWNPSLGLAANASTIEAVYEYYADLYRADPDRLWWAGMAALIGPSFYGGFQDLSTFATILDGAGELVGGPLGVVLPPGFGDLGELGADELANELEWFQERLLLMQQEIFFDMATAHEAYLDGGVETVERLYTIDQYGFRTETIDAWRQLDEGWRTGDQSLVAAGNATLLRREQEYVIADEYDRMRDRPVTGEAITYLMTALGAPSVPGARSYGEVFPATIEISQYIGTPKKLPEPPFIGGWIPDVPLPHIGAEGSAFVETPLPDGNISNFDDRWALIEADTLPVYTDLAANHPDVVLDVLTTPVGERAEDYTIGSRWDDLLHDAITNWNLGVDVDLQIDW